MKLQTKFYTMMKHTGPTQHMPLHMHEAHSGSLLAFANAPFKSRQLIKREKKKNVGKKS